MPTYLLLEVQIDISCNDSLYWVKSVSSIFELFIRKLRNVC